MRNRRNILRSVGSVTAVGLVGNATASESSKKASLAEVGLEKPVENLLQNGKVEKAHNLLEKFDVKYFSGRSSLDDVSIEEVQWSKDASMQDTTLVLREDDVWIATNYAVLDGKDTRNVRDARYVDDAFGMDWDNDNWTAIGRTKSDVTLTIGGELTEGSLNNSPLIDIAYEDYTHYGVGARVKFDNLDPRYGTSDDKFWVSMQTDLIKETSDPRHSVTGHYVHTFSATPIGMSISLGPAGFDVNTVVGTGEWELESNAYP